MLVMAAQTKAPDSTVARVGDHQIRYRDIACSPDRVPQPLVSEPYERRVQYCRDAEQRDLEQEIGKLLIAAAAEREHITASASDIDVWLTRSKIDDAYLARVAADRSRLPHAALQIHEGKSPDASFSAKEIEEALREYPTADAARKRLAQTTIEAQRQVVLNAFRERVVSDKLDALLKKRAIERGADAATYKHEYWVNLASTIGVSVIDSDYHMPEFRR